MDKVLKYSEELMNACRIAALHARSVDRCAISVNGNPREKEKITVLL